MATQVGNVIFSISADLKQLQGQLRTMEGNFQSSFSKIDSLTSGAARAFGAFTGLLIGTSIAGFAKEVINLGGHLTDLSQQTGISAQALSGMKSVLEENGTSLDAFARGVFNAQKNLGEIEKETDPAAQAIKRLGLNLDDLRNSSPDDFIKKVTNALAGVENPAERAALATALLGKSAKELLPALDQMRGKFEELKANGLDDDTIRRLDAVGDALTRLKNQALLLGGEGAVALLKFFGVIAKAPIEELGKLQEQADALAARIAQLSNIPAERIEGMQTRPVPGQKEQRPALFDLLRDPQISEDAKTYINLLIALRDRMGEVNAQLLKPQNVKPFKGPAESAKAAKTALDGFLESLGKQADQMRVSIVQLNSGERAALEFGLSLQFAEAKARTLADGKMIPPDAESKFNKLRDTILSLSDQMAQAKLNADALKQTLEQLDKAFPEPQMPGEIIEQLPPVLRERAGGSVRTGEEHREIEQRNKEITERYRDMEAEILAETLSKSEARILQIQREYEKRIQSIEEWKTEASKTAENVGEVEAQAAELAAKAWAAKIEQQKADTDELTEFQRRAFERMHDAMSDIFRDFMSGQIKGWKDLGLRIKKVIDDIVSEYLAMQLKIVVFGEDYGKKGGKVGGIAGKIGDIIFGGKEKPPLSDRVPGGQLPDEGGTLEEMERVWALQTQNVDAAQQNVTTPQVDIQAQMVTLTGQIQETNLPLPELPDILSPQDIFTDTATGTAPADWLDMEDQIIRSGENLGDLSEIAEEVTNNFGEMIQSTDQFTKTLAQIANIIPGSMSGGGGNPILDIIGTGIGLVGGLFGGGSAAPAAESPIGIDWGVPIPESPFNVDWDMDMNQLIPRQHGGMVVPTQDYLVGEKGPERFRPDVAGRIDPTGKGGGNTSVTMNVYAQDAESFKRSESQILARMSSGVDRARQRNR